MLSLADAYPQSVCQTTAFCQSLTTGKSHDSPTDLLCHNLPKKSRLYSMKYFARVHRALPCSRIRQNSGRPRLHLEQRSSFLAVDRSRDKHPHRLTISALPSRIRLCCPTSNTNLDSTSGQLNQFRVTYSGMINYERSQQWTKQKQSPQRHL